MRHPQGAPPARRKRLSLALVVALVAVVGTVAVATVASAGTSGSAAAEQEKIKVGLITKDVTNPFFVKMRAGATAQAKKLGAELIYAAGKNSSDNAGQITAIENMVTAGVKGFSSPWPTPRRRTPRSRRRGRPVLVIALDSPTSPRSAVDALLRRTTSTPAS